MVGLNVRKWGFYDKTVKNFKPFCWWDAFRSVWMTQQNAPTGTQGGETGIGKMAAEKVWVPPAGREAKGGILNRPRRQMSFLSFSDSCELAPLRVCELANTILCVSFWVMPRMLGKFPESFRLG
jgi:hypothetical protein